MTHDYQIINYKLLKINIPYSDPKSFIEITKGAFTWKLESSLNNSLSNLD